MNFLFRIPSNFTKIPQISQNVALVEKIGCIHIGMTFGAPIMDPAYVQTGLNHDKSYGLLRLNRPIPQPSLLCLTLCQFIDTSTLFLAYFCYFPSS